MDTKRALCELSSSVSDSSGEGWTGRRGWVSGGFRGSISGTAVGATEGAREELVSGVLGSAMGAVSSRNSAMDMAGRLAPGLSGALPGSKALPVQDLTVAQTPCAVLLFYNGYNTEAVK